MALDILPILAPIRVPYNQKLLTIISFTTILEVLYRNLLVDKSFTTLNEAVLTFKIKVL